MTYPKITFHGAARCVTGSCFRVATPAGEILIDCGMFQGSKTEKELNYRTLPFAARDIAAVILSHAHIDHSGLLPKLVREGFSGPIYATHATADLAGVMLPDSAHIQEVEVKQLNRRRVRSNRDAVEPIYSAADVDACLEMIRPQPYDAWFSALPGVRARLWNAGHLLGSASIEIELAQEVDQAMRLMFSADIGPDFKLMQPNPQGPQGVDYLFCESTYGDTDREDATPDRRRAVLRDEVKAAMRPDGVLLIPSFAVERAQELISDLSEMMASGELPPIPVYVDSPMAARATRVFANHAHELAGGAAFLSGVKSPQLHFTETVEDSKALDEVGGFHIVIAASGMCEAGRIRHRLKNWIWRDAATVLLVGFQAIGTLGRILQEGATSVRIQGEEFNVRARIRSIDLYSGHADGPELVEWIKARLPLKNQLFLVHGESDAMKGLASRLQGVVADDDVLMPSLDESFELTPGGAVRLASAEPPRIAAEQVARLDWHNDVSRLLLDINDALHNAADEKARGVLIRRLSAALKSEASPTRSHTSGRERRRR